MQLEEKRKLTLRLEEHLIQRAKAYASQHDTSVSHLVESFFRNLSSPDEFIPETALVRQLNGILPPEIRLEDYYEYLVEKYNG
ncbi:MAG: DUF6364 family protein [Chloroflexota bacterium]